MKLRTWAVALTIGALAGAAALSGCGAADTNSPDLKKVSDNSSLSTKQPKNISFRLAASSDQLKKCMPKAKVDVSVGLQTDATGRDTFKVDMSGVPAKTSFTVFLLETP